MTSGRETLSLGQCGQAAFLVGLAIDEVAFLVEEVVASANAAKFGLAAGMFRNDLTRAHRVIAALNARTFWINTYNITGIEHYTQLKSVYVALAPIDAPR